MKCQCLECGASFKNKAGLHIHANKHGGIAEYYQRNLPNRDRLDGSLINFKNPEQYLGECFNSLKNRSKFLQGCSTEEGREVILHELAADKKKYKLSFLPCQNFFISKERAGLISCERFFGTLEELSKKSGLENFYNENMPDDFWHISDEKLKQCEIHIDTREQLPFEFNNSMVNKLDFGDYCAGGDFYSQTFVDRKSLNDFKGTFGVGMERFSREVARAKMFNSFLFVVVEAGIHDIIRQNEIDRFRTNLSYAFSNVRKLLIEHSDVIQFVFCKDRHQAQDMTKRILYFGKRLYRCDVQLALDKHNLII